MAQNAGDKYEYSYYDSTGSATYGGATRTGPANSPIEIKKSKWVSGTTYNEVYALTFMYTDSNSDGVFELETITKDYSNNDEAGAKKDTWVKYIIKNPFTAFTEIIKESGTGTPPS